jgi:hypothetical protein
MSMQGGENGPRTSELVGQVTALQEQLRNRGNEIEKRLTTLETKMATIAAVGALVGSVIVGVTTLLVIHVLL